MQIELKNEDLFYRKEKSWFIIQDCILNHPFHCEEPIFYRIFPSCIYLFIYPFIFFFIRNIIVFPFHNGFVGRKAHTFIAHALGVNMWNGVMWMTGHSQSFPLFWSLNFSVRFFLVNKIIHFIVSMDDMMA